MEKLQNELTGGESNATLRPGLGESAGAGGGRRCDWDVVQGAAGVIFDNLKREVRR